MPERPLLVFPVARRVVPEAGRPRPTKGPHVPDRDRQVQRLTSQVATFREDFQRYSASIQQTVDGLEPETVLVIEIAGSVEDFKQAVDSTEGLEWLGEWDAEDAADEDFFHVNSHGEPMAKAVAGRLFVSMTNEAGLRELLGLWDIWQRGATLPWGRTKWRDVFAHSRVIRRWGIEETLDETGMIERWRELLEPVDAAGTLPCQIELFYRRREDRRRANERALLRLVAEFGGETLGDFVDMPDIKFHAVKVGLPAGRIRELIAALDGGVHQVDYQLFNFQGVMYFRPTGQAIPGGGAEAAEAADFPEPGEQLPPMVAILDGAPNVQHAALRDRILIDDAFDLVDLYQPGERRHGSSMASLVIHGDQLTGGTPLRRPVYHVPVLQPDEQARRVGRHCEHVPHTAFLEDRIERAVRRMLVGDGESEAQAPRIKIINVSIGDPDRPFIHSPSPLARLLDYLSWKHRVLFCVSAGNYQGPIELDVPHETFAALPAQEKATKVVQGINNQLSGRRLLAPAEALNVITVGALHTDESGAYVAGPRVNLLDQENIFSPASRFGHGFRRSMKPEIFLPGGRQLYRAPVGASQSYSIAEQLRPPGQKVAYVGYGALYVARVLECTEQRGTVLACDEIAENEIHEYRLPLPGELSASTIWRRLVVTLAWFSPMNFAHRNLREAKLDVQPLEKWGEVPLRLARVNADHNQVLRGTVQHEVLEADDLIEAFVDGDSIALRVTCRPDAAARIDVRVPYALAVTLEVDEGVAVPIYTRLREGIRQQVRVVV